MSLLGSLKGNPEPIAKRRVPRMEPTLEEGMVQHVQEVAEQIKQYAPTLHPDRVSATTKIMSDAIRKVFEDTAAGIDQRVNELDAKVNDIKRGAELFKDTMHQAADALIRQIELAMAQYEDLSRKMQESPFGPMPAVTQPKEAKEPKEKNKKEKEELPEPPAAA